jgi:hypothetical protein
MHLRKVLIKKEIKCWDDTQNFNSLNVSEYCYSQEKISVTNQNLLMLLLIFNLIFYMCRTKIEFNYLISFKNYVPVDSSFHDCANN